MSNYRILISYAADKELFVARAPELQNCRAESATRGEALDALEQELDAQIEVMKNQGVEPPRPLDEQEFDGKLNVEVSADLHRELAFSAKVNNVELEALLAEILAKNAFRRPGGGGYRGRPRQQGGRGRPREGQGSRYHGIMENRADFIDYVRRLDTGGPPHGRGGRRGGKR